MSTTVAATGLDGAGAERFIEAMRGMIDKIGHQANFTFNNGTVRATATVDCPPTVYPQHGKDYLRYLDRTGDRRHGRTHPGRRRRPGITGTYEKFTNDTIEADSRLAKAITSLGGFLSTALLTYLPQQR